MRESSAAIQSLPDGAKLTQWLVEQASEKHYTYLLAHLDDGIVWGIFEAGSLKLSGAAFPEVQVELRRITLQQLRMFGPAGECLLWRNGSQDSFSARYIDEDDSQPAKDDPHRLDETFMLWGEGEKSNLGFTLMHEGQQGFLHAAPILAVGQKAALQVRHYIQYDADGQAYISHSRLVDVQLF